MSKYILAHDMGTSGDKAVLFTLDGKVVKSVHGDYPTYFGENGAVEQNPLDWWKCVCDRTQEILQGIDKKAIAAITFGGQMMGCTCIDKNGNPLRNSIIWADGRSKKQMEQLAAAYGEKELYYTSGHRESPYYSLTKFMWVKENQPEIYQNTYKTLNCKDFIVMKLTGKYMTDYSDASSTMAFDIRKKCWATGLIETAGLDPEKFAEIRPGNSVVGEVTRAASEECGLLPGTPVVLGGGDGPCCRVGMGVVAQGDEAVNIGTSAFDTLCMNEPLNDPTRRVINFAHVIPGLVSATGTMQAAGASITWMHDNLCFDEIAKSKETGKGEFSFINANAAKSPVGANGLLFLPYLQGERAPHWNADAKGVFVGLTMKHTVNDMKRAVYEGIALNLGLIHNIIKDRATIPMPKQLVLTGGAAKSKIVSQTMADIFNMDMLLTNVSDEVGSLGAAVVAGYAIGEYKSMDMARKFFTVTETVHPIEENVRRFKEIIGVFQEAYDALVPVFPKLHA